MIQETIHSKAAAELLLQKAINTAGLLDMKALAGAVNREVLSQKIKFPAL